MLNKEKMCSQKLYALFTLSIRCTKYLTKEELLFYYTKGSTYQFINWVLNSDDSSERRVLLKKKEQFKAWDSKNSNNFNLNRAFTC